MSNKAELVDGFLALSLDCALEERNKSHPSAHLAVSLSPFVGGVTRRFCPFNNAPFI